MRASWATASARWVPRASLGAPLRSSAAGIAVGFTNRRPWGAQGGRCACGGRRGRQSRRRLTLSEGYSWAVQSYK